MIRMLLRAQFAIRRVSPGFTKLGEFRGRSWYLYSGPTKLDREVKVREAQGW